MKIILFLFMLFSMFIHAKETSILSIHSYDNMYPWTKSQNDGFKKAIATDTNIIPIYSSEYMDTKRKEMDSEYKANILQYMQVKYNEYKPELIYVTDDNALDFTVENIHEIFPKTPIIFSGVNNQSAIENLAEKSYTGIIEKKEILPNIELIQKLFPYEKEILIIGDASKTSNTIHRNIMSSTSNLNIKFTYVNENNFQTAMREIKDYKGKVAILTTIGGYHLKSMHLVPLNKVLEDIVNTGLITFSMEDIYIYKGVLGGYVVDGSNTGFEAGKLALKILKNPSIKLNTSHINSNKWIFDMQALDKYNITLPKDIQSKSILINKPESFYKKNEKLITYILYMMAFIIIFGTFLFLYYLYSSRKLLSKREKELKVLTENLNKAQEIVQLGSWEWDIVNNSLWWSDEIYRIFGLLPQEFQANYESFIEHVHPDDRQNVQNAVNRSVESGHVYRIEHRIIKKDGTVRYVLEEGHVKFNKNKASKMFGTVRDVTKEFQIKEALQISEKKYKSLVENSIVGIFRTHISGNILYVNSALAKILSFSSVDELIGKDSTNMYSSQSKREDFFEELVKQQHINNFEMEVYNKHRELIPIMLSASLDGDILSGVVIDMREIKESQAVVNRLSKAIEQIEDSITITDINGIVTYVNEAFIELTGYSKNEIIGETLGVLKSGKHDDFFYTKLWEIILKGKVYKGMIINRKKNGDIYYEKKTITPLKDDNNKIIGFVSAGQDVTLETLIYEKTKHLASTDKLTGLYNRHKFDELYAIESEKARRFSSSLSLILLDIDLFKKINDTYGHDVGDEILVELTSVLQLNIRKIDILSRWGGEEFIVLCPNTTIENAKVLAEKFRREIEKTSFKNINNTSLTISLGVSEFKVDDTFSSLFKRADKGLYLAKNNGRNQVWIV